MVNSLMLANGIGGASQNLYAQFLYRISEIKKKYKLTDCHIALFCKPNYLSSTSYQKFRKMFFDEFYYVDGILFNASEFENVSDKWGISFSIFGCGENLDSNNFKYGLIDNVDGEIISIGNKIVYNADGIVTASEWAKKEVKKLKTFDEPNVSSAIKIRSSTSDTRGMNFIGNLGYFMNAGNNVYMNVQKVSLFSTAYGNGHGHGISKTNFTKCTALFASRKLIEGNWINDKDEYLAPDESHPLYTEFVNDSIVYSLFHSSSNQSSLRQIEYKGKFWDIKNEFFWMNKTEIMELANDCGFDKCYNDARISEQRFVFNTLKGLELSQEAQAVLDKACSIVRNTFKFRQIFDDAHSEYQLMNWDCGWYQIKAVAKEYAAADYAEFRKLFKALSDNMRPMVYELGFLK